MIAMGVVRGLLTLTLLLAFLALSIWLAVKGKGGVYEAAARLPLESDEPSSESER